MNYQPEILEYVLFGPTDARVLCTGYDLYTYTESCTLGTTFIRIPDQDVSKFKCSGPQMLRVVFIIIWTTVVGGWEQCFKSQKQEVI